MKKILICGATGFIGRNTAEILSKRKDFEIYGTYFQSNPYNNPDISLIKADLRIEKNVKRVTKGMDVIIQTAASTTGVKDSFINPHAHIANNAVINSLILRAAFDNSVSHFIFPSCTVMYKSKESEIKETDFDGNVHPRYFGGAWTKIYLEKMCEFYSTLGRTKHTAFRHSNVYGPYDKYDLEKSHVFGATIAKVMSANEGEKITVWGEGKEERDLIYVDDLVSFIESAIDKQNNSYELVNVGLGKSVSVDNLVKKIIKASGKGLEIEYDITKPSIKTKIALDCSRAKEIFGWEPKISLDEGIEKTIKWYKEKYGK